MIEVGAAIDSGRPAAGHRCSFLQEFRQYSGNRQIMTENTPNLPETGPDALDDQTLYAELVGQTAKVDWSELERFFAKGQVIHIASSLDLVDVAMAMIRDRSDLVVAWQAARDLASLEISTARRWAGGEPTLWAVVTPPWILVQEADSTPAA